MRYAPLEVAVGGVVLLAAILFLWQARDVVQSGPSDGYTLHAQVANIGSVRPGTDVRMSGVKIGQVIDIALDPKSYFAKISLKIRNDLEIPIDTTLKIASEGLLGGQYVTLEVGGAMDMMASGDEFEYTQGAVDLMSLIGQAVFSKRD